MTIKRKIILSVICTLITTAIWVIFYIFIITHLKANAPMTEITWTFWGLYCLMEIIVNAPIVISSSPEKDKKDIIEGVDPEPMQTWMCFGGKYSLEEYVKNYKPAIKNILKVGDYVSIRYQDEDILVKVIDINSEANEFQYCHPEFQDYVWLEMDFIQDVFKVEKIYTNENTLED